MLTLNKIWLWLISLPSHKFQCWTWNHILYEKLQCYFRDPLPSLIFLRQPFHALTNFKVAPSYQSSLSKRPHPSSTTHCCFGKLLNKFYNTPKKSKIHLNIATIQCCFGKLLNKLYYIPKKSKIHLNIATTQCYFVMLLSEFYYRPKKSKIRLNIATTQFCFDKLLNEFYYTPKKS